VRDRFGSNASIRQYADHSGLAAGTDIGTIGRHISNVPPTDIDGTADHSAKIKSVRGGYRG
jgi:hypothetical protein